MLIYTFRPFKIAFFIFVFGLTLRKLIPMKIKNINCNHTSKSILIYQIKKITRNMCNKLKGELP